MLTILTLGFRLAGLGIRIVVAMVVVPTVLLVMAVVLLHGAMERVAEGRRPRKYPLENWPSVHRVMTTTDHLRAPPRRRDRPLRGCPTYKVGGRTHTTHIGGMCGCWDELGIRKQM